MVFRTFGTLIVREAGPRPMYSNNIFENRVALVTGAGRGIGAGIAKTLANLGADVAVNDINHDAAANTVDEIEQAGSRAVAIPGDVSEPEEVEQMIEKATSQLGTVRHVVSNAGMDNHDDLVDLPVEQWQKVVDVNLTGTFLIGREVAKRLIEVKKSGSIVTISSIAGLTPHAREGAYSPTKSAIIRLTEQMALEFSEYKIRANSICPGPIWTEATDSIYSDEEMYEKRASRVPVGEIGDPEDVANAAVFLLAPQSTFVTGASLVVDGGMICSVFDAFPGETVIGGEEPE